MEKSYSESYKAAGVDVVAGYESVKLIKPMVESTFIPGVIGSLGGFGGLFRPDFKGMADPILVSGTDGVGTKLKLAFLMDKHDTVGIDCVAMCVNDIACCGAQPLFFLDYIAVGKNHPAKIAQIVSGVAEGCVQSACALVGGETAEMPGFYPEDEYDLAGFCVGVVNKDKILDKESVRPGDVILGLASSGVHSNGFSLVRKVFDIRRENLPALTAYDEKLGKSLLDALLTPTRIYVQSVLPLLTQVNVRSICHITGGGFSENIPRALPAGVSASIQKSSYAVPPIFRKIQAAGDIPERDMYNTFNMGLGLCVIVPREEAGKALTILEKQGELAWKVGEVISGGEGVELW